jgi:hypothetical protein
MELALLIAQIANTFAPTVSDIIMVIRKNDNSVSIVTLLDEADSNFNENIKQATDWLKAHPKNKV